jgi:hypothetical protein
MFLFCLRKEFWFLCVKELKNMLFFQCVGFDNSLQCILQQKIEAWVGCDDKK